MTETEIDEFDLSLCTVIAFAKAYGISLACLKELLCERTDDLFDEVPPAPVIH